MTTPTAPRRRRHTAIALAAAAAAAGSLALAAPAQAATNASASVGSWGLNYQAGTGQTNHVKVSKVFVSVGVYLATRIRIDDTVTITPGAGCYPVVGDATSVTCNLATLISVHAGDGNDSVTVTAPIQSVLFGEAGNDVLTSGPTSAGVENWIFGGDGDDTLKGGSGRDLLSGGTGADSMSGGAGVDTVSYGDRTTTVYADPDGAINDDGSLFEHDTIQTDVENLWGGSGNDYLTGTDGANELLGSSGNDVLRGKLGADVLTGGTGSDTVTYDDHTAAVWADLDPSTSDGASGEHDTISTVENLTGGTGNDVLVGDNGASNTLNGGSGNDTLIGQGGYDSLNGGAGEDYLAGNDGGSLLDGGSGKDRIFGGSGTDTVSYQGRTTGVTVRLDQTGVYDDGNSVDGPVGSRDNIDATVENVLGGYGSDVVVGNALNNTIRGNGGVDYLYGGNGNDSLYGATQYDYLYGQSGYDLCDVGNQTLSDPIEGVSFTCEAAQPPPE